MNRELLQTQWPQIRELLREKFSNLTDEDIRQINGRYDELVIKLQQKYGYNREEAEERIRSWNFDRFESSYSDMPMKEDRAYREDEMSMKRKDDSSWLKWLLGLGIPLLLLGTYYLTMPKTPDVVRTPPVNQEQVVAQSPADLAISNGIRNSLIANSNFASDMQNVRITTNNGVVTLSGTVSNPEVRNSLVNTAQNYTGVRQVINDLQVK
jgi:uncharacterized protein YjbJ (UPF0337 family)